MLFLAHIPYWLSLEHFELISRNCVRNCLGFETAIGQYLLPSDCFSCRRTNSLFGIESKEIWAVFLNEVLDLFHDIDKWPDIFRKWGLDSGRLAKVGCVLLSFTVLVSTFKSPLRHLAQRLSNAPPSLGLLRLNRCECTFYCSVKVCEWMHYKLDTFTFNFQCFIIAL